MTNPDVHAALFTATPPWANSASLRVGVAWWGDYVEGPGRCDCCGQTRRVRKGYNGGAHMPARFCGPCTANGHTGCAA